MPSRTSGADIDTAASDIEEWLQNGATGLSAETVDSLSDAVTTDRVGSGLLDRPASAARLKLEVVGGLFLMLVLLYFFLKDGAQLWTWVLS